MKIAVLVSGGVDSTVALRLLKDQGHEVTAFYLKIWLEDELLYLGGQCPWEDDLSYVRAVCDQAGVPLEIVSLQREYWDYVVAYTIAEVKAGRTPNPDILCNKQIKFGFFLDKIDASYQRVATGHYAQVVQENGIFYLKRSPDLIKDQTYFLAGLTQAQLARALFPIGHMPKEMVRQLAQEYNVPNKDRKDSQGICFLGKLKFSDFIKHHLGENPGVLVEFETGIELGQHKGFWFHTIGQRQGTGLSGGPWYVVHKDAQANIVYVSRHYRELEKNRTQMVINHCNWLSGTKPATTDLQVKIRHGKQMHGCTVQWLDAEQVRITLQESDQGLAPGQFAVLYDGDYCLGSGVIT